MATGLSIDEQLAAATELNRARVAPRPTEDDAPKEEGAGASFRELKHKAQLARAAIAGAPDIAEKAKEELKNWAIDVLLPSWGIIRWFRAGARGEVLTAGRMVRLIVLLYENVFIIFIVLGVLGLFSLITSWYLNPWKLLTDIVNLGWSAISAIGSIFWGIIKPK